jgi:hypothetical protein
MQLARASFVLTLTATAIMETASAGTIDLTTPEGANLAMRKIHCSLRDNHPVTYYWHGETHSRVPGEPDRKLFTVQGMNIRQCVTVDDPQRGKGYRLVSRELLFYFDPQSGALLETWRNPWTGKEVEVIQTANDPVNAPPTFAVGRDGKPAAWTGTTLGNQWWITWTIPLFYPNPLGGPYQQYVGGTYHATEMFNFFGDLDDLLNDRKHTAQVRVGWVRISNWLPWMEMGDRPGALYFHSAGRKVDDWSQLSPVMREEIDRNYPAWKAPPPGDDARPNETSWTYFRKKVPPPAAPGR